MALCDARKKGTHFPTLARRIPLQLNFTVLRHPAPLKRPAFALGLQSINEPLSSTMQVPEGWVWYCVQRVFHTLIGGRYLAAMLDLQIAVAQHNSSLGLIGHSDRRTQYASSAH